MPRAAPIKPIDLKPTAPPKVRTIQTRGGKPSRPMDLAAARTGINTSTRAGAALISPDKPLTAAQLVFAKGWAAGESISTATLRAGYKDNSFGHRMSSMPNVLKAYHAEKVLYEEAAGMTRKKVMGMLLDAYADAKMVNEPASMVSAAREIGKMCGYYEPVTRKLDITLNGNVVHDRLNRMSDAELLKLITSDGDEEEAP